MYYQELLDDLVENTRQIFAENLVGIYLHGSLAMGCFHPQKSDIDLIIIVEQMPDEAQKLAFMDFVVKANSRAPEKGLELSVVRRKVCDPFVYPTPFELHFSNTHLEWYRRDRLDYVKKMTGTDKDLAAHFAVINRYGITLWGAPAEAVFAEVSREAYLDSIWYDVGNAPEDILEAPMYITLNLCRAYAYASEGLVLSKAEGGEWGFLNLPERFAELIGRAGKCYASGEVMVLRNEAEIINAQEFGRCMLNIISFGGEGNEEQKKTTEVDEISP